MDRRIATRWGRAYYMKGLVWLADFGAARLSPVQIRRCLYTIYISIGKPCISICNRRRNDKCIWRRVGHRWNVAIIPAQTFPIAINQKEKQNANRGEGSEPREDSEVTVVISNQPKNWGKKHLAKVEDQGGGGVELTVVCGRQKARAERCCGALENCDG